MGNRSLSKAKKNANDEFYTQLETIEKEVFYYKKHFKDKVVYCNCDDPRESNFFKYFLLNFEKLGLKKLISSCYKTQDYNLLSINQEKEKSVWIEYDGYNVNGESPDLDNIKVCELKGDGDFRSEESINLLKEADIVVTNPPFSLFRELIKQLIDYEKDFLILGSMNALTYKEVFPLVKADKLWLGCNSGDMNFKVPNHYEAKKVRYWKDDLGQKWRSLGNIAWWTNLEHPIRKEYIELNKNYKCNELDYPKYDNYNAINVDKVADIPKDYDGVMGVPITFINKWNPEQFRIVGFRKGNDGKDLYIGERQPYVRILIERILGGLE